MRTYLLGLQKGLFKSPTWITVRVRKMPTNLLFIKLTLSHMIVLLSIRKELL